MDASLKRVLVLVSAIVLVDVCFYSAITPLLPWYQDELGLTKSQTGVLAAAYAVGTLAASIPAGWLASRWGARPTLLVALTLLGLACVAFGFGKSFEVLVAARLVQGIGGAGSWAAGMAWLLSVAPREQRGQMIGTALGVAVAGAIGGPIVGALAETLSPEVVFSTVAIISLALATGVLVTPADGVAPPAGGLAQALTSRRLLAGIWLTALPALFFGAFNVLTALRLDDVGVGAVGVAAVFLIAAAVEAALSPLVGRFADREGELRPLRAGVIGVVIACVVFPAPNGAVLIGVVAVGAAVAAGLCFTPAMALLSAAADGEGLAQGVAFGLVNLAWAGGQIGGSAGGAGLADATSDAVPFAVLGVLALATLAVVLRPRVVSNHG